jgi:hypothetical protein
MRELIMVLSATLENNSDPFSAGGVPASSTVGFYPIAKPPPPAQYMRVSVLIAVKPISQTRCQPGDNSEQKRRKTKP